MKIFSTMSLSCLLVLAVACDKKSSTTSMEHDHADAAVATDDPAVCSAMEEGMGLHGAIEGYTASAQQKFFVKVDWSGPLASGATQNKATVTFLSHHGEPLALTLSGFHLFMPAMGHGTRNQDQQVLTQDPAQPHIWTVEKIQFSMGGAAGDWVVDVKGSACGHSDQARVVIAEAVQ